MENSDIIKKADLALSDLQNNGGYLSAEQSGRFIRKLIEAPTIIRRSRVVTMGSPKMEINKIGFGRRILRPGEDNTALSEADRAKPDLETVNMDTKEVLAEINLPYRVIEDNIERGNVNFGGRAGIVQPATNGIVDTILDLVAERAALDLEELALMGDTASSDKYLKLLDGFIKQATSNIADADGTAFDRSLFTAGMLAMPNQYKRAVAQMAHYISTNNEIRYRDTLAGRETALGDASIQGRQPVFGAGVPVTGVNLMPENSGLLTMPQNMIFGIQRDISFEVDKDIRARKFIIVVSARIDFKYEEEEAVVRYNGVSPNI